MKAPCDGRFRTVRAKYEDATMSGKTKGKEAYKDLWTAILRTSNSDGWGEFDIGSSLHYLPRDVPRIDRDPNLRKYSFKLEKIACDEQGFHRRQAPPEIKQRQEEIEKRIEHFENMDKTNWPERDVPGGPLTLQRMSMTFEEVQQSLQSGSTGARPRRPIVAPARFQPSGSTKRTLSTSGEKPPGKTHRQETPASVKNLKSKRLVSGPENPWMTNRQSKLAEFGIKKLSRKDGKEGEDDKQEDDDDELVEEEEEEVTTDDDYEDVGEGEEDEQFE